MTYQGSPAGSGSRVMKILVVITIAMVAYWAATGGLDEIGAGPTGDSANVVTQSE